MADLAPRSSCDSDSSDTSMGSDLPVSHWAPSGHPLSSTSSSAPSRTPPPPKPLMLKALNHISRVCTDVEVTSRFYQSILGFRRIKRPGDLSFNGAWLFSDLLGLGIHLIQGTPVRRSLDLKEINIKDDHLSFVAVSLESVEAALEERNIPWKKQILNEDGVRVQQIFFHDPDYNMVEICNCDELGPPSFLDP